MNDRYTVISANCHAGSSLRVDFEARVAALPDA